jgi:hypothetical protein
MNADKRRSEIERLSALICVYPRLEMFFRSLLDMRGLERAVSGLEAEVPWR